MKRCHTIGHIGVAFLNLRFNLFPKQAGQNSVFENVYLVTETEYFDHCYTCNELNSAILKYLCVRVTFNAEAIYNNSIFQTLKKEIL